MYEADESDFQPRPDEATEILRPSYKILWKLVKLWDEMGIDEHQRDNRLTRAQEMVVSLLQDLVTEEEETKRMVLKRIDDLKHRIRDLASELELSIDSSPEEVTSMVKQEKMLHSRMTHMREMKQKRMSRFESLRSQEIALSKRLGQRPSTLAVKSDRLPSEVEIDRLSDRVASLNNEKESRLVEAQDLGERLQEYIRELDVPIPEELKDWPRFDDVINFEMDCPLTASALAQLREVTENYRIRRDTAELRCEELLVEIDQLWSRLGTSESDRTIFLKQLPVSKPASLQQLEDEVKRLVALKRANMKQFIEECRAELRQWWERCYIPLNEQDDCLLEEDEDLTKQLEELEKQISRLKKYYEENEVGFQKIIEWNAAFEKLKITEYKLKDPSVLSNRGGVLLKYEKAKRATQRQMQAQEAALGTFISLKVEGQSVLAYIEARRQGYEEEKENEKRERQEKHSTLLHKEMRYGSKPVVTPGKKRFLSSTLRQVNTTCVSSVESPRQPKLRKMETASSQFRKKLTACDSLTSRSPLTPQPIPSRSLFRTPGTIPRMNKSPSRVSLARRRSRAIAASGGTSVRPIAMTRTPKKNNVANLTRSTTYSEFADVHSKARSSIGKTSSKSSQYSSQKTTRL